MGLHKDFPKDPYEILKPEIRWFPAEEDLRKEEQKDKLLPPLVPEIRQRVFNWREKNYEGVSDISKILLNFWFNEKHINESGVEFKYYFSQREAVETIIYLYEIEKVRKPLDLLEFDTKWQTLSRSSFIENWLRLVIKMATGSGKTKVLSLLITWSYFHRLYVKDSELSRNFLLITPNIIVLDRIKSDFLANRIFFEDPCIPENGYEGYNWKSDFQIDLHIQDDVRIVKKTGNIFLTNIHRIYENDVKIPTIEDENTTNYFLGKRPTKKTNEDYTDLSQIVREIDELLILNDEAHHIHDEKLSWFQSIKDIDNKMRQEGKKLSMQIDVTATPKTTKGNIFPQTICDYPLAEAIIQEVVKHPVIPDGASESKLKTHQSYKFTEKYRDFINLGVEEWKLQYEEYTKLNKKALLFLMIDETKNCDEVGEYLEKSFPELKGAVLTIHTNSKGDINESTSSKKSKENLDDLRKKANEIDSLKSPYKAIVSVMMLKEGWDVRNVTTIVGLRAYSGKSNILAEQALGRGLRKMFFGESIEESVSVVGNSNFMDFIKTIEREGVILEKTSMGSQKKQGSIQVISTKNDENLDIEFPVIKSRLMREIQSLENLEVENFESEKFELQEFSKEEQKEIIFRKTITNEDENKVHHSLILEEINIEPTNMIRWFVQKICSDLRFYSEKNILYGKMKYFIENKIFEDKINLYDPNVIRNFSRVEIINSIIETFKFEINNLIVKDIGDLEIKNWIKLSKISKFSMKPKENEQIIITKKSIFNKMILDSKLEIEFVLKLEGYEDIISYAKNYFEINHTFGVNFNIKYRKIDGSIGTYYPDFFVKKNKKEIYIVETKGYIDENIKEKMESLKKWCTDINEIQDKYTYKFLYVNEKTFYEYKENLKSFENIVNLFDNYQT